MRPRIAAVAGLLTLALAGSARADTTVIGSLNLPPGATVQALAAGQDAFQFVNGDANYVAQSPVTGIITSWSYRQGALDPGEVLRLRILGDAGTAGQLRVLGTTASAPATPDASDVVRGPFASSVAIQAGERVALENVADGKVPVVSPVAGAEEDFLDTPNLSDGSSSTFSSGFTNNTQLLVQATVDFTPSTSNPAPTTPQPATPPDQALSGLAAPVEGRSVDVARVSGTVLVRIPPSTKFVPIALTGQQLPVGTEVDVTNGRIRLTAAAAATGTTTKTADFFGGRFTVTQPPNTAAEVQLKLTGPLARCATIATARATSAKATAKPKPRKRFVWGSGHGNFQTVGQAGSAAVRGTIWLVEDRCDGSTLVVVKRGLVAVRDTLRHRTIMVAAGHRYLIRAHH